MITTTLKIASALFGTIIIAAAIQNRWGAEQNRLGGTGAGQNRLVGGAPAVSSPFKNLFDDQGQTLNVVLIAAPFRTEEDEQAYELYKSQGLAFCGISSYINFPGHIENPH